MARQANIKQSYMNNQMSWEKKESRNNSLQRKWAPPIQLGGNWNTLSQRLKKQFPAITRSDLQFMARGENELIARLQLMTGKTKSEIRQWIRESDSLDKI